MGELTNGEVGIDHGVAEKLIALVGSAVIEETTSVLDNGHGVVFRGGSGEGGAGCNELCEEVEVVVERVTEYEGVNLKESGDGDCLLLPLKKV